MLANGTGKAMVKTGGDTWFFLTADYAFGHALERDTAAVVRPPAARCSAGAHPLPSDFSSFLLQAQASKAKVIGLANAGGDTTNSIKQAAEFGITRAARSWPALLVFITDVHALGLNVAQGLNFTETFYWDMNDGRAPSPSASQRTRRPAADDGAGRRLFRPCCTTSRRSTRSAAIRMTAPRSSPR
jgi:branched-chain amino acid transport system substrate-binding protein